jgi:DNA-binding NarL/FixJ family response regulator
LNIPVILIVDDEPDQLANIKSYLGLRIKCNFVEALNGEDAIKYIKDNPCDVMILDIRMPQKTGIEVLDISKDMPIHTVVFTGWDSDQVFDACKARGVTDYIPKGSSLKVVFNKVVKALKKKDMYYPAD